MPPGVVHDPVDSASAPPLSGRGNYLPTQSQSSYHSASSSPSTRRPSSGFDGVNEEANVRASAAAVDGHADVHASAVMTHDNDDGANVIWISLSAKSSALHPGSKLLSTLISLLAPSTSTTTSLALHFSLHSPPSHLPSPLLLFLLLLGSPSEIQEFSLSYSSFSPIGGCLIKLFNLLKAYKDLSSLSKGQSSNTVQHAQVALNRQVSHAWIDTWSPQQDDLSPFEYGKRDSAAMAATTRTMKQLKSRLPRISLTLNPQNFEILTPEDSTLLRSASLSLAYAGTCERLIDDCFCYL